MTDARGIVRIIMLLPCRTAAPVSQALPAPLGLSRSGVMPPCGPRWTGDLAPVAPPLKASPQVSGFEAWQTHGRDVSRIRKTNEAPPRVSVFDAIRAVAGVQQPEWTWRQLKVSHPEVLGLTTDFKFPGRGQRDTPVTDARGIVRIIMLLPCRTAAPIRAKAADVLVRYLGGDPSLVPEIQANRELQEHLAREDPEHPARIFGEAVESRVHPPPIEYNLAPELKGAPPYALRSGVYPGLFKTGSSKDPPAAGDRAAQARWAPAAQCICNMVPRRRPGMHGAQAFEGDAAHRMECSGH